MRFSLAHLVFVLIAVTVFVVLVVDVFGGLLASVADALGGETL